MRTGLAVVVVAASVVLPSVAAFAHHSFAAEFDANKPVTLTGTVTRIEWMNPHTWFYIDVTDESGTVTNWGVEMGSPNGLMRAGWTRTSMAVGDVVVVEASLAKDGSKIVNASVVTLTTTGQRLFAASSQTEGAPESR